MYTQCPNCLTIYRVAPEDIGAGRGSFRCGHCGTLFDALPTLVDQLPLDVAGELPRHPLRSSTPVLNLPALHPNQPQQDLFAHLEAHAPPAAGWQPEGRPEGRLEGRLERQPELPADWAAALGTGAANARFPAVLGDKYVATSGRWPLVNWIMAVLLLGQLTYAEHAWLRQQSWFRVLAAPVLKGLGHELAPLRASAELQLLGREIRPHPVVAGALLINASIRNKYFEAVAYPVVEIRLTDINGRVHALRRFAPAEYLGEPTQSARGLAGGALVPLVFEVVDPGQAAMNFEFRFL